MSKAMSMSKIAFKRKFLNSNYSKRLGLMLIRSYICWKVILANRQPRDFFSSFCAIALLFDTVGQSKGQNLHMRKRLWMQYISWNSTLTHTGNTVPHQSSNENSGIYLIWQKLIWKKKYSLQMQKFMAMGKSLLFEPPLDMFSFSIFSKLRDKHCWGEPLMCNVLKTISGFMQNS